MQATVVVHLRAELSRVSFLSVSLLQWHSHFTQSNCTKKKKIGHFFHFCAAYTLAALHKIFFAAQRHWQREFDFNCKMILILPRLEKHCTMWNGFLTEAECSRKQMQECFLIGTILVRLHCSNTTCMRVEWANGFPGERLNVSTCGQYYGSLVHGEWWTFVENGRCMELEMFQQSVVRHIQVQVKQYPRNSDRPIKCLEINLDI